MPTNGEESAAMVQKKFKNSWILTDPQLEVLACFCHAYGRACNALNFISSQALYMDEETLTTFPKTKHKSLN